MNDLNSLALYVHWPWCLSKCPYCDFNSRANAPDQQDQDDYRTAILSELGHFASQTKGRKLSSIFFGGGTPSLIDPATIAAIIDDAERLWGFQSNCEITLEANPTSVETGKFRDFQRAGVNRVSVGIQALNNTALQALGREHSALEAQHALDIASAVFDRFTFDIIYARPGQGLGEWHDELDQVLQMVDGHVSLYQLTVEPGTDYFRNGVSETDADLGADFYELTQNIMDEAGMPAYEVSNHAKPGQESRHNLGYWLGCDYLGIGPGAHARLTHGHTTTASHQIADPKRWLDKVTQQGHGTAKSRILSRNERQEELVLAGLRLTQGIDCANFKRRTGHDLSAIINTNAVEMLQSEGLVFFDQQRLAVTASGRLVLSAILEKLLA